MAKWITTRRPKEKVRVLVKRRFEDGKEDVRIGYLKHLAGIKSEWYFVVPQYDGEYKYQEIKKWKVIAWQELPV